MREMTSSLPGLLALGVAGTLWAIAFVLIRGLDEGGRVTPLLAGALARRVRHRRAAGGPAAARPRAGRPARRAHRRARPRAAAALAAAAADRAAGGALGPRLAPGIAPQPPRGDRAPARPRRAPRRPDRAALHRAQGRAGAARRRLLRLPRDHRRLVADRLRRRRHAAGSCPTSCSRAPAGCARSGSSATCRTSSTSSR